MAWQDLFNLSPEDQQAFATGMQIGQQPEAQMQVAQLLNPPWAEKPSDFGSLDFLKAPMKKEPSKTAQKVANKSTSKKAVKVTTKPMEVSPAILNAVAPQEIAPSPQFKFEQNVQPLDLSSQIKTEGGPFSPEGIEFSKNFYELQTPGMRQQRATLDEIRKMIGAAQAPIPSQNLAWLMGLSDIVGGGDMLSKYKTPQQQQYEQKVNQINMMMGLAKEEGGLTGDEKGLLDTFLTADIQRLLGGRKLDAAMAMKLLGESGLNARQKEELSFKEGMQDKALTEEMRRLKLQLESKEKIQGMKGKTKGSGFGQIIPGWVHDGKTEIVKGDIPKLQNAYSDSETALARISSAISLLKGASSADLLNPFSSKAKKIAQELADAQLTYKGEGFANLGVLTGPDVTYLNRILMPPTSVGGLTSSKEDLLENYQKAMSFLKSKLENKLGARGLIRAGGSAPQGGGDITAKQKRLEELRKKEGK